MQVLGSKVALDHTGTNAVSFRIGRAWAAYHTHRSLLCKNGASMTQRLRIFRMVVASAVLWGLENFALTVADRKKLTVTQITMVSRMCTAPRSAYTSWLDWFKSNRRRARRWLTSCGQSL